MARAITPLPIGSLALCIALRLIPSRLPRHRLKAGTYVRDVTIRNG